MPRRRPTAKELAIRARNRANARKSTGPRTAEGKARSARNGLRHGLRAATGAPGDDAALAGWVERLNDTFRPSDAAEAAAVERLAAAYHRLETADALEDRLLGACGDAAPGHRLVREPRTLAEFAAIDRLRSRARGELARAAELLDAQRRARATADGRPNPDPAFSSADQRVGEE